MTVTAPQRRYRALIVEDDPAIRRLVEKLLSRHQVEIDAARDGREAVDKLRTNRYSVLVLDLMVPELNGFQVIDFLKEEKLNIPVAVVSAVSQQALTKLDLDVVKLVISKPFDVDEFTKAVLTLCAEAEGNG
ncbi:MAG TPA: response regulator [Thermoanaerobaculia bacterium]|jgi:DNA-binding response OmpR family regulator|nr:response regulator [Thermoanaerobaculia bacterium]